MDERPLHSGRALLTRLRPTPISTTAAVEGRPTRVGADIAPFAAASLLAAIVVPIGQSVELTEYVLGLALVTLSGLTRLQGYRLGRLWSGELLPSLIFLAGVAVMRQAGGVVDTGLSILALLPVFWTALHGNRRQLGAVTVSVAVFFFAPALLIGGVGYPHSQYRTGLLYLVVSVIVGLTTQRLVFQVRRQARHAHKRERMLEQIAEVVRGLSGSQDARSELCRAAMDIAAGDFAILCEPEDAVGRLQVSAFAAGGSIDVDGAALQVDPRDGSAIRDVFATGRSRLWSQEHAQRAFTEQVHHRLGCPRSALLEPIFKSSQTIGVLVVGWLDAPEALRSKSIGVGLLAHEIAVAIERADAYARVADQARTDALTGLPNRRAWDQALARALQGPDAIVVAMLDLDHFKAYNDSCGHPAGDRLLKETAAAWREELRGRDMLARLGGEEFALLFNRTPIERAVTVVDRLCARIPSAQTCSAGITICQPNETSAAVMARVDEALYDAKARGRNRASLGPPAGDGAADRS